MEDVITEAPPPSRFLLEDLNNFTKPSPAITSPFILFSDPRSGMPLCPKLLLIANSSSSRYLFHDISSKNLIGCLILPEIPFAGNTVEHSLEDRSCNIYRLSQDSSTVLVSFQFSVPSERAYLTAKLLIGDRIIPERVLILDSIQSRNFRGKLSPDDTLFFKLETSAERNSCKATGCGLLKDTDYFPSGSVVDGLGAALLSRCQMMNVKATLGLSWPEADHSATLVVKSALRSALPDVEFNEGVFVRENHLVNSELYT